MDTPANADPKARRDAQARQVRAGCSGCLVFLLLELLVAGGFKGLEHGLRAGTLGRSTVDMVLLEPPENHAKAILWIGAVTLIALVAALNVRTTRQAVWRVGLVLVLSLGMLMTTGYARFVAIRALAGGEVELVFLWPRPNVHIEARRAVVAEEIEASVGDQTSAPMSCLLVTVDGTTYRSEASGAAGEARRFLLARGATPPR